MSDPLDVARRLVGWGIPVFACPPDPSASTGYRLPTYWQEITADPRRLAVWRPGYGLAMVCGHGLDVLDTDPRNGGEAGRRELLARGLMPQVLAVVTTPSGGLHEYVASLGLAKAGNVFPGVDYQGGAPDGSGRGFVFLPPTVRVSKASGELTPYAWAAEPIGMWHDASGAAERLREYIAGKAARRSVATSSARPSSTSRAGGHLGEPIPHGSHDATIAAYAWGLRPWATEEEARLLVRARGRDCVPATWTDAMSDEKVSRAYAREPEYPRPLVYRRADGSVYVRPTTEREAAERIAREMRGSA